MASGKEIRNKIKSVENTRKITKAMEMVAASKMRKAQDRMRASRPYGEKIRRVASNLAHALTEYKHPFLQTRAPKNVGIVLVTSDKGLCGGLNANVLRLVLSKMKAFDSEGVKFQATCVGNKGLGFMQRAGAKVVSQVVSLGDTPHLEKLIGPLKVQRKARMLWQQASRMQSSPDQFLTRINAYAFATAEENASGGVIVTAPTCGSCGVLPAVLYYLRRTLKQQDAVPAGHELR